MANTHSNPKLEVATTILEQLGGGRLMAMTGAKHFVGGEFSLSFKLPAKFAKDSINHVRIELTPMDDYTVTFSKIRGMKITEVSKVESVYCDTLQDVFEHATGLFARLM